MTREKKKVILFYVLLAFYFYLFLFAIFKKKKLALTSKKKKKKKNWCLFILLLFALVFSFVYKCSKKNQISNFEFQNSKIQKKEKESADNWLRLVCKKEKKNRITKFKKKKKNCGIIVWFYLHEPRSSQTIEPLSWDPKPRLFQDLSLWATKLRFEPLSHDLLKPSSKSKSQNPSHQASKPRSDPSSRDTSQVELSQDIWAIFLLPNSKVPFQFLYNFWKNL